jgi:hypothetical protein
MAGSEVVKVVRRSKRVRFERPCSRSARAAARARVPAPPVTVQCISFLISRFVAMEVGCNDLHDQHVLTALPSTAKRAMALPSAFR